VPLTDEKGDGVETACDRSEDETRAKVMRPTIAQVGDAQILKFLER
jgi:hypothetical protein